MIPPKTCSICGGWFVSGHINHCEHLAAEIAANERRLISDSTLLRSIVEAFKARGEAIAEILNAAYEYGYSVSRTEPKWLDVEISKQLVKYNGCSKHVDGCRCRSGFHPEHQCKDCRIDGIRNTYCECSPKETK